MGLFSKLKDYNVELEEILDKKYFSSTIKSLLFSMVYKLEAAYPDFKEVKRCVRGKEDFLNEVIETIRLYCDNFKIVEPDSNQAKILVKNHVLALTNEKERSVLAYPTESAFLYALSDISPKYFYMDERFIFKDEFQNLLVNGYNLNNLEIINDFNGWNWSHTDSKRFEYVDNLIYQMLLIILGEKFLYEWRIYGSTRRDFLIEMKNYIKIFTGNDNLIKAIFKVLYYNTNRKDKLDELIKNKLKFLKAMDDKDKFMERVKLQKDKINKKINRIDLSFENSKLLVKQFEKVKEKNPKIKSIKQYEKMLISEREKNIDELSKIDFIMKSSNFTNEKHNLEMIYDIYKSKTTLDKAVEEMLIEFVNFLNRKLNKMNTRDELIDMLVELRYFGNLKINKDTFIYNIEILEIIFEKLQKKVITKLCKLGAMKIVSMDIGLNYEIIKYALQTRIINLEEIKLYFEITDDGLLIKVFDKDVIEKQGLKRIQINSKMLEVKQKRKIKLFI